MFFLFLVIFVLSFAYLNVRKSHPFFIKWTRKAIMEDRHALLELLLFMGINPDIYIDDDDDDDITLLHYAASYGLEHCVNILLSYDAKIDLVCKYYSGRTAMQLAVRQGYVKIVDILIDMGADINYKDELRGETTLHIATYNGYLDMVHLLLLRGAHVNVNANESGLTPLMHACEFGDIDIVERLLDFGADINLNTEQYAMYDFPTNALYIATSNVHVEIQKMLLTRGASIIQECENGDVITAFTDAELFHEIFHNLDNWPTMMFILMMENYDVYKGLDFKSIQDFMEFTATQII